MHPISVTMPHEIESFQIEVCICFLSYFWGFALCTILFQNICAWFCSQMVVGVQPWLQLEYKAPNLTQYITTGQPSCVQIIACLEKSFMIVFQFHMLFSDTRPAAPFVHLVLWGRCTNISTKHTNAISDTILWAPCPCCGGREGGHKHFKALMHPINQ